MGAFRMSNEGPEWGPPGAPTGPPGPTPPAPPPYPDPPYRPYPPYPGGYGPRPTEGNAIAALVLAIVSFVIIPFVTVLCVVPAIIALVLAKLSREKIAASNGALTGEGLNKAAVITAWVNIGLTIAFTALVIIFVVVATTTS